MKRANLKMCWAIPTALVGFVGFLLTLITLLEVGGAYYVEYAISFVFSISVFGIGALYTFLELYNDYLEKE